MTKSGKAAGATRHSDPEAARKMQTAKQKLFASFRKKRMRAGGNDGRMESSGKPNPGFPLLSTGLGNRWRDSHISTAPTTVRLVPKHKKKGAILGCRLRSSPGSSLDWKTLSCWPSIGLRGVEKAFVIYHLSGESPNRFLTHLVKGPFKSRFCSPYSLLFLFREDPIFSATLWTPQMLGRHIGLKQENVMFDDATLSGRRNAILSNGQSLC